MKPQDRKAVQAATDAKLAPVKTRIAVANTKLASLTQRIANIRATPVPPASSADADFIARRSAPGVIRWWDFNSSDPADPHGLGPNNAYSYDFGYWSNSKNPAACPVLDTSVKASGASSMRFDIRPHVANDGQWFGNFSPDLLTRFDAGSQFFAQMRLRWNDVMVNTLFNPVDGGTKFFDVVAQDMLGMMMGSSSTCKIVVHTYARKNFVIIYRYFPDGTTSNLYEDIPGSAGGLILENKQACYYPEIKSSPPLGPAPGCWQMPANEFVTFMLGVMLGPRGRVSPPPYYNVAVWMNSTVRLWAARDRKPPQLLIQWDQHVPNYTPLISGEPSEKLAYGKLFLFPYMTNKDLTQEHGLGQVWYDEPIISREPINFPGGYAPPSA